MNINLVYNPKASETINRLKKIGEEKFGIKYNTNSLDFSDNCPTLYYGISNFNLDKHNQAIYFEDIIPNTLLSLENYEVISDYDLIIMKNPTRLLLWKDAKNIKGTKYLYVKDKDEWRINYSYGKVRAIYNKNINGNVFGKADITHWSIETNTEIREYLKSVTKLIAEKIENDGYDLKSFGLDIIRNNITGEFLFLELNQANSMNEAQCEYFIQGYLDYICVTEKHKKVKDFINTLTETEKTYLIKEVMGW